MSPSASCFCSTPASAWDELIAELAPSGAETGLYVRAGTGRKWLGWGGCFNEAGWVALSGVPEEARAEVLRELFDPAEGCGLSLGRVPIGASDYALDWYSCCETPGDYAMESFSIERDRRHLVPFVRAALAVNPGLALFASPWSPPTWMKDPPVYNYGRLRRDRRTLAAYALYLVKFAEAWRAEGLPLRQLHPQNEPVADQKFPSCLWSGAELRDFIRDHLGPLAAERCPDLELWLGTINCDDYNEFAGRVLADPEARRFVRGVGYQWAGRHAVEQTRAAWPELAILQTETECGDGTNSWAGAERTFYLARRYVTDGADGYVWWNMVLPPGGASTWGWKQNSLVTADPENGRVDRNPEFQLMRHLARFVRPGAEVLVPGGPWAGNALGFRQPEGGIVFALHNPFDETRRLVLRTAEGVQGFTVDVPGRGLATVVISGGGA